MQYALTFLRGFTDIITIIYDLYFILMCQLCMLFFFKGCDCAMTYLYILSPLARSFSLQAGGK